MSGPICPDCGVGPIVPKGNHDSCEFCGWSGPKLPRKILSAEMYRKRAQKIERKRDLRKQGKLFFVRIYVSGKYRVFTLLDILEVKPVNGMRSIGGPRGKPKYIYVELDHGVTDEMREKLLALDYVTEVTVR